MGDGVPQLPEDGHGLVPAAQRPRRLAAAGGPAAARGRHDGAARHRRRYSIQNTLELEAWVTEDYQTDMFLINNSIIILLICMSNSLTKFHQDRINSS